MSHFMRSFMLVAVGFVAGIIVTMLLRRTPAPQKPSAEQGEKSRPVSKDVPSQEHSKPARAASDEKPAGSSESQAPPAVDLSKGIKPAARRIPDAGRVRIGRPEPPNPEEVLKAPTWDEFYKQCRERKIAGDVLEDLILRRVSQDLGLDTERADAMKKLFRAEQEAATRAIFENAGGMAGIEKLQEEMEMNWKTIHDDWRRQRDVVRQAYNDEYLKIVAYDKLNYFNEHLRNAEINFFASYGPESDYFLIGGVGKPPK